LKAIKKFEKRMNASIATALSCAELLGKDAVMKIFKKDYNVESVMATNMHLMIAENIPLNPAQIAMKNDIVTLNKKKAPKIRVANLRDYLTVLKRRYGNPDGECLGRITIMGLEAIDKVLTRYYKANFLLDPIIVSYLKKKELVPDTPHENLETKIFWDPRNTCNEIRRFVEGKQDKRANPANLTCRIDNLKGYTYVKGEGGGEVTVEVSDKKNKRSLNLEGGALKKRKVGGLSK